MVVIYTQIWMRLNFVYFVVFVMVFRPVYLRVLLKQRGLDAAGAFSVFQMLMEKH